MIGWIVTVVLAGAAALWWGRVTGSARARRRSVVELEALRTELSQRLDEIYSLQELSFVLSESLQPDRIAERIADYVARFFPVDGALLVVSEERGDGSRVAAATGKLAHLTGRVVSEDDRGLLTEAMGRERLELAEPEGDEPIELLDGEFVDRAAVLPMRAHGVTVGALTIVNRRQRPFSSEDLRLLSTVASHTAIVLSNAQFVDLVRSARDQWETTFDALKEGIAVVDERGRIRRANRALADLIDAPIPTLTGMDLAKVLFVEASDLAEFLASARHGKPLPPLTLAGKGEDRTLRITAAPMRGEEDTRWVAALVDDISEELAFESQLIQSEKMAAVGQLVSGIAHELNNPLTSIAGLSEFLLERVAESDRDRDHLRIIHEQADRASRIVRDLLTFARHGPSDVGALDLNDIVLRTLSLVGHELRLREVHVATILDPELPAVDGDRYQIQQVVLNLVTNAVQAVADNAPDRSRHIEITTVTEGNDVVLRVADTGPGIPDDLAQQVFNPFFTTKEPGKGTGLGLSISFQIVQQHGGTMTVRRGNTDGAVFAVRLPARALEGPDDPQAHADAADPDTRAPPNGGTAERVVLIVDDDPAVRRMIAVLLASDTLTVEAVQNAAEAVGLLESRTFDLIIADPRAAVSAGDRFAEYVFRRWPKVRDRTILLTADVRPETDAWLRQLGCRYFFKPFRVAELKAAAAAVLAVTPSDEN